MPPSPDARIAAFLDGRPFAVVGASRDRGKYGNKVLRCYLQNGCEVLPINPGEAQIEGVPCYPTLAAAPGPIHAASIITPPEVTETIVEEAAAAGVRHLWMQPGAESPRAIERAAQIGLEVIAGGPCVLVVLGFRE